MVIHICYCKSSQLPMVGELTSAGGEYSTTYINLVSNSILNIFFYTQIPIAVIHHQISFIYWADGNFYWNSQVWKVQRLKMTIVIPVPVSTSTMLLLHLGLRENQGTGDRNIVRHKVKGPGLQLQDSFFWRRWETTYI